jgi:hypothetical protein
MRPSKICLPLAILAVAASIGFTVTDVPAASRSIAVGPQYDTTHVYGAPEGSTASLTLLSLPSAGRNHKRV